MGNDFSKGVDSAVSIITGIITGDMTGGLAGASAPWLAEQIKLHTGHMGEDGKWQTDDIAGNLIAHAILGAVVAELQGNSALSGGVGAVSGELASKAIINTLYGGKDASEKTVIHVNPNTIPSGINRGEFNKWKTQYWIERAKTYR